jgi:MFS family permease
VFLVGLTLFGVASVAGAVAPNVAVLLIARAAQGITSTARQLGSAIGIATAGGILSWGSGADLALATHAGGWPLRYAGRSCSWPPPLPTARRPAESLTRPLPHRRLGQPSGQAEVSS